MTAPAVVYRSPFDVVEALGRGETMRVPMKGRTEECSGQCSPYTGALKHDKSCPVDNGYIGERLVAPIQPATPCPYCWPDGLDGEFWAYRNSEGEPAPCPTCNDTGWVGDDLGLVTEQCRHYIEGPWVPLCGPPGHMHPERRLVVPWRTQVTDWTDGVATLVGLWPIDPPVVEMWQSGYSDETGDAFFRVPLSVDPGEAAGL